MLLRGDAELVVEVVPDLLHVVPVGDDAVLDGVAEGGMPRLLCASSPTTILLAHAHHHALVAGATHDGGKTARGVVPGDRPVLGESRGGG